MSAVTNNAYTWMANTFQKVDGTTTKLSDFALVESQSQGNVKFYLLNQGGATLVEGGLKQIFQYVHPNRCTTANKWLSGWYYAFKEDGKTSVPATEYRNGSSSAYWAGDVEIPYGTGFGILKTSYATTVSFNGAVASEDKDISATADSGKYTWMGNVMPVDYTLKDFSLIESQSQGNVKIYKINAGGATLVENGMKQIFQYVHPNRCTTANKWLPGWYYAFKEDGKTSVPATEYRNGSASTYWAGEVTFKAGEGFGLMRASYATTLRIPTPLD